jgi:hypothetical protein
MTTSTPPNRPAPGPQPQHRPGAPTPQHQPSKTYEQHKGEQHKDDEQHKTDPKTGASKDSPTGIDPNYNTKPPNDEHGGDQSAHPSPITDPTNTAPEPAQFDDENPRPPLAKPGTLGYVAGQPVDQEEYEKTEREAAEKVRPEAWERLEGQGVEVDEGMKTASSGWSKDTVDAQRKTDALREEGTRPDGKPLRDPNVADDDVNKRPGGVGGQGTRADGRARAPDTPIESRK